MKPLTEQELLWHKDPLTIEEAATLLSGKPDSGTAGTAGKLLATAIEGGKLRAEVVRWPEYDWDLGYEVDRGRGNINENETTIRMEDFKVYCLLLAVQIRLNMAEKSACLQVVSAEMPRSQPCYSVSPLRCVRVVRFAKLHKAAACS